MFSHGSCQHGAGSLSLCDGNGAIETASVAAGQDHLDSESGPRLGGGLVRGRWGRGRGHTFGVTARFRALRKGKLSP